MLGALTPQQLLYIIMTFKEEKKIIENNRRNLEFNL